MLQVKCARAPDFRNNHEVRLHEISSKRCSLSRKLKNISAYWGQVMDHQQGRSANRRTTAQPTDTATDSTGFNAALRHVGSSTATVHGAAAGDTPTSPREVAGLNFTCCYCAEDTGPSVDEHLERC